MGLCLKKNNSIHLLPGGASGPKMDLRVKAAGSLQ